jgi:replicative DNA helicase
MAINTNYEFNLIKQAFTDKDKFLFCIEKIKNPEIFLDPIANLYWRIFKIIYQEGQELSFSKVEDILRTTDNAQHIGHFKHVVEGEYTEEYEWQYHLFFLEEQYRKSIMLEMASMIQKGVGKSSSQQILELCNSALRDLNSEEANSVNFKKAYEETVKQITDIHTGSTKSVLITGNKRFDEVATLSPKKLITWAAQKKIGKSRFMVDLVQRLITHNPKDVAIQWYSLEMKSEELVRCFISRMLNLTDKQLMGKGYKITEFEMGCISNLIKYFEKYPIEFIDEAVNINNICSKFERFAERHPGKTPICIIDNLGLIKPHINDSIAFDDDVARMLKNLRDKTGGMINVLHHLTKESESKWNKDMGYEPKTTHIRGSSRIADFSNMVVLLHRPDHYKDLVEEARLAGADINGRFIVNISENRDGESDRIVMNHKIQYCHFSEEIIDPKQEIKT